MSQEKSRQIEDEKRRASKFARQRSFEESIDDRMSTTPSPSNAFGLMQQRSAEENNNGGYQGNRTESPIFARFDQNSGGIMSRQAAPQRPEPFNPFSVPPGPMSPSQFLSSSSSFVNPLEPQPKAPKDFYPAIQRPRPIQPPPTRPVGQSIIRPTTQPPLNPFSNPFVSKPEPETRSPWTPSYGSGLICSAAPSSGTFSPPPIGHFGSNMRPSSAPLLSAPMATNFDQIYSPGSKNTKVKIAQDQIETLVEPTKEILTQLFIAELDKVLGTDGWKKRVKPIFQIMLKNRNISVVQLLNLWMENWNDVFQFIPQGGENLRLNCGKLTIEF